MSKNALIELLLKMRPGDMLKIAEGNIICLSGNMYTFCGEQFGLLGICREVIDGKEEK